MEQEQRGFENRNIHEPLPVNFERIPARIRGMRQFVVWRYVQVEDELKKPPFDPKTGKLASVAKQSTWGSLADAKRAYDTGDYQGIGIVLTQTLGVVGIDIDHCRKDTGQLTAEAGQIITDLASFTEVSPSGTGIRILLLGKLPGPYRRRGNIEMYEDRRFLTLTGHTLDMTPPDILSRQEELQSLYQRVFSQESLTPDKENTGGGGRRSLPSSPASLEAVL